MELNISEEAAKEFNRSVEGIEPKPYLRVGAKSGGCSGWTFILETDKQVDSTDNVFMNEEHDVQMIINTEQHENLRGDLLVDYSRKNLVEQGFIFKRTSTGTLWGWGESFTPVNSEKKTFGW